MMAWVEKLIAVQILDDLVEDYPLHKFEKIGRMATGRKFFGFRRSSFLCSGITFAFFQNSGNFLEEIDKLIM